MINPDDADASSRRKDKARWRSKTASPTGAGVGRKLHAGMTIPAIRWQTPVARRGAWLAVHGVMVAKRFVYVIQSEGQAAQYYVGHTANVMTRLASHNGGESPHTRKYRPWRLVVAMTFATEDRAAAFAKFLKSGPGEVFVKRHIIGRDGS